MNEILKKTHEKSYFKHFHNNSPLAQSLFVRNGDTVILQIMKIGSEHYLAEVVDRVHLK